MINVLFVYGDILRHGGMEIHMMNYFRNIDREKIHIDFLIQTDGTEEGVFDEEIKEKGSIIYYLPKMKQHPLGNYYMIAKILKSKKYQIVHAHSDAMNYRYLKMAWFYGIPVRISHSHNTQHVLRTRLKYHYYEFCRRNLYRYATKCFACSELAGKWMYQKHPFEVIPNALELDRFGYNPVVAGKLRKKYGIAEKEMVLGHIGRFDYQKNQEFLLQILQQMQKQENDTKYRLVMLGEGWQLDKVRKLAKEMDVEDSVIFAGDVDNPQDYYNMMDVFLLPSRFEGFPLVLIEAQANGLKCIVSDQVTTEVNLTGQVVFCPLDIVAWIREIKVETGKRCSDSIKKLTDKGYNIKEAGKVLSEKYSLLYEESLKERVK